MKMKKHLLLGFIMAAALLVLVACGSTAGSGEQTQVSIGVTGADGQYWNLIKEKAQQKGIEIKLIEFSDYTLPNHALANGEVDMNSFQHIAFLSQFNVENGTELVPIGSTVIAPMGLYSDKYTELEEIPDGAKIAIPNDPSNSARALRVLDSAGLLKLKEGVGLYPTVDDIENNPKKLEIVPVVAQQTPRVLPDVAGSLINSGVAGQAGFKLEEALVYDDPYSEQARPYINVFAVRAEERDNEAYQTIVQLYQEEDVAEAVERDSNGGSIVVKIPVKDLQFTLDQLIIEAQGK